jgi:hypothetical protein
MAPTESPRHTDESGEEGKPVTEQDEGLGEPDPTAPDEEERRDSEAR